MGTMLSASVSFPLPRSRLSPFGAALTVKTSAPDPPPTEKVSVLVIVSPLET